MVADFFSIAAMRIASRLGIPFVINVPGPTMVVNVLDMPTLKKTVSIAGLTLLFDVIAWFIPNRMLPLRNMAPYFINSLVLFSSCPGLETIYSMPQNFKFIGPSFSPR